MGNSNIKLKIETSLKYNTLDYKWAVRKYIGDHKDSNIDPEIHDFLLQLATSSFNYYYEHKEYLESDISLKAISSFCINPDLMYDVTISDTDLDFLSRLFNQIIHSTRDLHKCYDCGTNARAMFFKLVEAHRGKYYISPQEQLRMARQYRPNMDNYMMEINNSHRDLTLMDKNTVFILSLGLDGFGHVYIIEKIFIDNIPRYHHYQTSFKSHLLLDFIENRDYGRDKHQSLDVDNFFSDFKYLMSIDHKWDDKDYKLFGSLFAFLPTTPITNPKPSYCYTYLTY